jgi:hypothetical protein
VAQKTRHAIFKFNFTLSDLTLSYKTPTDHKAQLILA